MSEQEYVYVRYRDLAPSDSSLSSSASSPLGSSKSVYDSTIVDLLSSAASSSYNLTASVLSKFTPTVIQNNKTLSFLSAASVAGLGVLYWAVTDPSDPLGLDPPKGGEVLEPTTQWQEVPDGVAVPPGLEIRMDLETGKRLARIPVKTAH